MINKSFLFYCLLVLLIIPKSAGATIYINNQTDFNNISKLVKETIDKGELSIKVVILPGTYEFFEDHITFRDIQAPNVSLKIQGKGQVNIIPLGKNYKNGDIYEGQFNIENSWMNGRQDVNIWGNAKFIDGLVEVVNEENKLCRFKSEDSFPKDIDVSNAYVLTPQWYTSKAYKINRIEEEYVYFTAFDLNISYSGGWNVNDDYNYSQKKLRYRLCNVGLDEDGLMLINKKITLPSMCPSIHEGKVQSFITIDNCSFKSIEINNLFFLGNGARNKKTLIYISQLNSKKTIVKNCSFIGMRSGVIYINKSNNIFVDGNVFKDCYYYGIISDNNSINTHVLNNYFYLMGKRVQNSFCVSCSGENFLVKNNEFKDFGYGGVAVGVWYGNEQKNPCRGIVENNEFSYSETYLKCIIDFGLMDGGAIYSYTKNDCTIIRNNFIHDISGIADNRGIFCDDGASGLNIYGNVIIGIQNSYCIDARRVVSVENKPKKMKVERVNMNNVIANNIIDGDVRFEANEDVNNGCRYGGNYILTAKKTKMPVITIKEVDNRDRDTYLDYIGFHKGKVEVTKESYKVVKRSPIWKGVKKHISK